MVTLIAFGTCHAFATNPEQSAPYDPECEQLGQPPEQLPFETDDVL